MNASQLNHRDKLLFNAGGARAAARAAIIHAGTPTISRDRRKFLIQSARRQWHQYLRTMRMVELLDATREEWKPIPRIKQRPVEVAL